MVGEECNDTKNENDDNINHFILLILLLVCNSEVQISNNL